MQKLLLTAAVVLCTSSLAFSACPAGWKSFESHCYMFQSEILNWVDSRLMCRWHNSDLMKVETPAEQAFLKKEAYTFNHTDVDDGFWLSGTDWENQDSWVWESDNTAFGTYAPWGSDQPNNRNNSEDCLASMKYFDYLWSDEWCHWVHLQYVCEMDEPVDVVAG